MVSRDDLGRAVDALMDAIGTRDLAQLRAALGDLLAIVFGRLTSTIGATLVPLDHKIDALDRRIDYLSQRMEHRFNELEGSADARADDTADRLDRKRAELDNIQERLRAIERGRDRDG